MGEFIIYSVSVSTVFFEYHRRSSEARKKALREQQEQQEKEETQKRILIGLENEIKSITEQIIELREALKQIEKVQAS